MKNSRAIPRVQATVPEPHKRTSTTRQRKHGDIKARFPSPRAQVRIPSPEKELKKRSLTAAKVPPYYIGKPVWRDTPTLFSQFCEIFKHEYA